MSKLKTCTRQELYDLVWKEPLTSIVKTNKLNYSYLKKICTKLNIPTPSSAYWSYLKYNKPIEKIPLPLGDNITINLEDSEIIDNPETPFITKLKIREKEVLNDKRLSFKVQKKLLNTDDLISKYINRSKEYSRDILRVNTSTILEKRALLFLDTLIKNLRIRGHGVIVLYGHSKIYFNNQNEDDFHFSIIEKSNRKYRDTKWGKESYLEYNGKLSFRCGHYRFDQKEWIDKEDLSIEKGLLILSLI